MKFKYKINVAQNMREKLNLKKKFYSNKRIFKINFKR